MSRLTRDGTAEPVSRDQILRHARGQENIIFPVQLTTSRTGNLTRLIHTLLYVMTIHTYITYIIYSFFSFCETLHYYSTLLSIINTPSSPFTHATNCILQNCYSCTPQHFFPVLDRYRTPHSLSCLFLVQAFIPISYLPNHSRELLRHWTLYYTTRKQSAW